MIYLIILIIVLVIIYFIFRFFKIPKLKNLIFIDGSLGTGKSFYSVYLAIRLYKKQLFKYKIQKFLLHFFSFIPKFKNKHVEQPVLYSNIKLKDIDYVLLDNDFLLRKKRFAFKSVVLLDEFSLVADQFLFKDKDLNEKLTLFFKLFRHETHGGYLVINSQSINDLHFSLKYVLSDYLYLHSRRKLPFFTFIKCRELTYCADSSNVVNVNTTDVENDLVTLIVPNKYYKKYDSYCYSLFTDFLPFEYNFTLSKSLKNYDLISFRTFKFLYTMEYKEVYLCENLES